TAYVFGFLIVSVILCAEHAVGQVARNSGSTRYTPVFRSDNDKDTQLLKASYTGDIAAARGLIEGGADPNARQLTGLPFGGESAVMLALDAIPESNPELLRYHKLIEFLLDHKGNCDSCVIPLTRNDPALIGMLVRHGVDPNRNIPMFGAIRSWPGDPPTWTKFIRALLAAGADPNARDDAGNNALGHIVFATGPYPPNSHSHPSAQDFQSLVSLLVSRGARVNDTISFEGDRLCGPRH